MNRFSMNGTRARRHSAGMTMIEIMVALVISMVLLMAIYQVLSFQGGRQRTTTSVNDINQAGMFSGQLLETWLRSAGSGFASVYSNAYGCQLYAARSGTAVLPSSSALPVPFDQVKPTGTTGVFRLAPVLIVPSASTSSGNGYVSSVASDVLIIMSGSAGVGDLPSYATAIPSTSSMSMASTMGYSANDIALIADQNTTSTGVYPCMVQQVASGFTNAGSPTSLSFGGTYYASSISSGSNSQGLTSFSVNSLAINLGNVSSGNPPRFMVVGVGANNTLYSYDLLNTSGSSSVSAIADSIFEMHAIYGVDTTGGGTITSWASPSSTAYGNSALMAGTTDAAALLHTIKAVRVGLILRTSLQETSAADSNTPACTSVTNSSPSQNGCVAPPSISLFSDATDKDGGSLKYTRTFTNAERVYRYRVVEMTIPLRNNLF